MEPGTIANWASAVFAGLAFVMSAAAMARKGRDKQIEALEGDSEAHGKKLAAIETRLSVVEGDMRHLPDKEATHRLEMAIAQLAGKMEAFDERFKPVVSTLNRIQDVLERERP